MKGPLVLYTKILFFIAAWFVIILPVQADVQAWAYLSLYFADKLRAGVALETFRKTKAKGQQRKAVLLLENAAQHWKEIIEATQQHYNPVPAVQLSRLKQKHKAVFSWEQYSDQVKRDIQIAEAAK